MKLKTFYYKYMQPLISSPDRREIQNKILQTLIKDFRLITPQDVENKKLSEEYIFSREESLDRIGFPNYLEMREMFGNDVRRSIRRTDKVGVDFQTNRPIFLISRYNSGLEELKAVRKTILELNRARRTFLEKV